jgi:hypothetical protein
MRFAIEAIALATVLAAGQICAAECTQPTPGAKSALSIEVYRVQRNVTLGSSLMLKVRMTNISRHDISVWMENGGSENQYEVEVRGQKGNLPAVTEYGETRNRHAHLEVMRLQDLVDTGSCVTLGSGKSIVQQVNISELYLFDAAGKYLIRVQRPDPQSARMVKSNVVRVSISPRDHPNVRLAQDRE